LEATAAGGTFRRSQIAGGGFIYLRVGAHLFDVQPCSSAATRALAPDQFAILSGRGVTFGSAFIELDRFEQDYARYQRMLRLPFFSRYKTWRVFTAWKVHVQRKRFMARKVGLESSLFVLHPTLRAALLGVREMCLQIAQLKLFVVDLQSHGLREWLELQVSTFVASVTDCL
jgi:hypothetical protein